MQGQQQQGLVQFLLVRDQGDCCFGGNPKITDRVLVQLADPAGTEFSPRLTKVAGRFRVQPAGTADLTGGGFETRPLRLAEGRPAYGAVTRESIQEGLLAQLRAARSRDIAAGSCLVGPHRDDMAFTVDGHDLRAFGSRGQQRTAALALKLAELQLMRDETGESPLLLLDDVMSELDAARRQTVLAALASVEQAIVTTTDWEDFSAELLSQARTLRVKTMRAWPL